MFGFESEGVSLKRFVRRLIIKAGDVLVASVRVHSHFNELHCRHSKALICLVFGGLNGLRFDRSGIAIYGFRRQNTRNFHR